MYLEVRENLSAGALASTDAVPEVEPNVALGALVLAGALLAPLSTF